jgi:murein DD-endopeptidase MepM/ murein hydrolase activator NlpD
VRHALVGFGLLLASAASAPTAAEDDTRHHESTAPLTSSEPIASASAPRGGSSRVHTLAEGETLWDVARSYGVSPEQVLQQNGLSDADVRKLRPGRTLKIVGAIRTPAKNLGQARSGGSRAAGVAGVAGVHYVARGETVWDLARRFNVSVAQIMAANHLSADAIEKLREGQALRLPGVQVDRGGRPARKPKTERQKRADGVAQQLGLGSLMAAGKLLHGQVEARWISAAGGGTGLAGTLRWPVSQGWFVRGFGSGEGGYHKAMDIMGKTGWNVRAAADGIVGYSGNAVSGFGNMVMVVHTGGWVTLYGHNSVNYVSAGERVHRGDVLAEVGSTGRSTGPHVHFELIYQGQNCDPAPLFRPGVRHQNGKFSKLQYSSWLKASQRPKAVQCAVRQKHPRPVLGEDPVRDAQHVDDRDLFTPTSDEDFSKLLRELSGPDEPDIPGDAQDGPDGPDAPDAPGN